MSYSLQFCSLLFLIASWVITCQSMEKPDCSRMVFHPRCRGISAKRSSKLPLIEEAEKTYNSDDSFEFPNYKSEVDSDLAERIMRDILLGSLKFKNHERSYYEDEK
ncbi:uncharacterized protein LOC129217147 isoform X1 [Uloborus diversus]|uniref:uncharacterized protein LOC129217147 isoform X1 n=1 Tax=Uloborus diversus TaxID=327109 RepID=UPI00240A3AA8|nr:uncharacterized protein LOC129217147 isoform X1 [Uloborus diversus]